MQNVDWDENPLLRIHALLQRIMHVKILHFVEHSLETFSQLLVKTLDFRNQINDAANIEFMLFDHIHHLSFPKSRLTNELKSANTFCGN